MLSRGWHGPHEATLQFYSGPASPYWASKAFVGLLAPPEHPLWTEPEVVSSSDRVLALPGAGLLIQAADGIVRLHNHGSDHVRPYEPESADGEDPHYSREAYSTRTGPTTGNPLDNHFAVVVDGVRSVRRRIHPLGVGSDWAASWHRPVFPGGASMVPGLRVESVTVARGRYELRVHRVVGAPPGARVELTGWATGPDEALGSALWPIVGWAGRDLVRAPAGTAFVRWARIPRLTGDVSGSGVFAAVALLGEGEEVAVGEGDGDGVVVRWGDGGVTRVGFGPVSVS